MTRPLVVWNAGMGLGYVVCTCGYETRVGFLTCSRANDRARRDHDHSTRAELLALLHKAETKL